MNMLKYLLAKLIKKLQLPAIKESDISKKSKVCSAAHVVFSKLGKYSYIGNYTTVIHSEIGNYTSIGDNCSIGGMAHPLTWLSTSPVFYKGKNCLNYNICNESFVPHKKTFIGHDVWIGGNCHIKSGITIANGAVIGMGSVVTKNVGPYEIWAGNPAKLIRKRFTNEQIEELEKVNWYDWKEERLLQYKDSFTDIAKFIESTKHENSTY